MSVLDFFKQKKSTDVVDSENVIRRPVEYDKPIAAPKPREHYRVGFNDQGMTTLTLMSDGYGYTTLTMNRDACEHLIRLLRATYQDDLRDGEDHS